MVTYEDSGETLMDELEETIERLKKETLSLREKHDAFYEEYEEKMAPLDEIRNELNDKKTRLISENKLHYIEYCPFCGEKLSEIEITYGAGGSKGKGFCPLHGLVNAQADFKL